MKGNHIKIGPVIFRVRSKHLAKWGFPRVQIGGVSLWSWSNTGQFMPFSYHKRGSITWRYGSFIGFDRFRGEDGKWPGGWVRAYRRPHHPGSGSGEAALLLGPLILRWHWQQHMFPSRDEQREGTA